MVIIDRVFNIRLPFGILIGELLAFLVLIATNASIFIHFYHTGRDLPRREENVARTFGHLICLNFCIHLCLPQRNSIWVPLLGISFERMVKYHRWMGRVLFGLITAHLVTWYIYWISANQISFNPNRVPLDTGALMPAAIIGQLTWLFVLVMMILSLNYFRRANFELFYYSHHLFIIVIALALTHSFLVQRSWRDDLLVYWLIPGILLYICDIGLRFWKSRMPAEIISIEQDEGGDVYHVRLRQKDFRFEAGQYIFVNFPQVSLLQWHPFSIATSPSEVRMTTGGSIFSLAIRDMGPNSWSRDVINLADTSVFQNRIKVKVDGPYGRLSLDLYDYPVLILIAGGIGVTPLFSVLNEFHNNPPDMLEKMYFLWCAKHQNYLNLFLEYLADMERNDFYGKIEIQRYVTHSNLGEVLATPTKRRVINDGGHVLAASNSSSAVAFMNGRPDFNDFFTRVTTTHVHQRIGVLVSGPTEMIDDVKNTCAEFNKKQLRHKIDVHSEGFFL